MGRVHLKNYVKRSFVIKVVLQMKCSLTPIVCLDLLILVTVNNINLKLN